MTEKLPTTEKEPKLDEGAAKAAEVKIVESHGEEKKSGWVKRGSWSLLMLFTGAVFLVKGLYSGLEAFAGTVEKGKVDLGGGGHGGGHGGGSKEKGHGGGHGGGH